MSNTTFARQVEDCSLRLHSALAVRENLLFGCRSTIFQELLQAIAILEKELTHAYNPLWLERINVLVRGEDKDV